MVQTVTEPGKYFDGHGLYLRVDKTGGKFWVQRIVINGKRRELGLGSFDFVTLADARLAAFGNRKLAREGGDPLAARRQEKTILNFEEAAREVHRIHMPTWKNPKHGEQFINTLTTYAFPTLGTKRVSDVTTSDVLTALQPIWLTKAETARRVKQRISTVMKWTIAKGWRRDNPVDAVDKGLPRQTDKVEHRKSLPYDQVATCLRTMAASQAGLSTKLCLEFLVLTCVRSNEAREARWSEIDLKAKVWDIPAERIKMDRPHRIPLSDRALAVLRRAEGLDEILVFPGAIKGKPLSDATLLKLIRENGFEVDIHGFRTSFRTLAQERTNFPREVAEAALAHLSGDAVERAYARSDLFEKRRKMMGAWAAFLAEKPAKVVGRIG
ncbi:tyrosine-type recombinase/integrase [Pseudogemmobacter blasticus]|uniref:Integrase n=1 Tax=Fuscovulum blasticum DSM 2131 TaxID=1188250 RepID=A0A2T4JDJ0_FUSBL|nr:integrase arm-type DNA-binding domain-containing protein [Fuscovulum blasticum]PTE15984.1 integrase [Fuscovulum blasticum DSM 2131]